MDKNELFTTVSSNINKENLMPINIAGIEFVGQTSEVFKRGFPNSKNNEWRASLNELLDDIRTVNEDLRQGREPSVMVDSSKSDMYIDNLLHHGQSILGGGQLLYKKSFEKTRSPAKNGYSTTTIYLRGTNKVVGGRLNLEIK